MEDTLRLNGMTGHWSKDIEMLWPLDSRLTSRGYWKHSESRTLITGTVDCLVDDEAYPWTIWSHRWSCMSRSSDLYYQCRRCVIDDDNTVHIVCATTLCLRCTYLTDILPWYFSDNVETVFNKVYIKDIIYLPWHWNGGGTVTLLAYIRILIESCRVEKGSLVRKM